MEDFDLPETGFRTNITNNGTMEEYLAIVRKRYFHWTKEVEESHAFRKESNNDGFGVQHLNSHNIFVSH